MKVIVNNIATEYTDDGTGQVIFMLHGWLDSLHSFDSLADHLSKSKRVIRLDLPGFGQTEIPPESWVLDDYISFVAAFITKLKLTDYVLLGHSFGGRIAIKGCGGGQLQPKALILIAAAGLAQRKTARNYAYTAVAKVGKLVTLVPPLYFWRDRLRSALYRSAKSDYLTSQHLRSIYLAVISEDLTSWAQKLKYPTLIIWGADDDQTPVADGEQLSQLIAGSKLIVIPETGHFVHQQATNQVIDAMEYIR